MVGRYNVCWVAQFSYLGIGRAIAVKLAECGASVVAISRTQEDLDTLKEQVSEKMTLYPVSTQERPNSPTSETPLKWRFAGRPIVVRDLLTG